MIERKKLFRVKRILALVLAVAMVVTSAPVTAQAATADNPEQTEADVGTDSTEEKEVETEEEAAAVNVDADADTDTANMEESVSVDANTDAENSEASETTPADADTENPETSEDEVQEQQPVADDASETVVEAESEEESVEEDVQADAEGVQKAEIEIYNLSGLVSNLENRYDFEVNEGKSITTTYHAEKENPFKKIVEVLKNGDAYGYSYVNINMPKGTWEEGNNLKGQLKYTWQQKNDDGNYADMGIAAPVNAGEYRLEISISPDLVAAEPQYIEFIIEKADLYITVDKKNGTFPSLNGKTVSEVKEIYANAAEVALGSSKKGFKDERYLQFMTINADTVTVRYALGGEVSDILKKGNDYIVEINPELQEQYKTNYELHNYEEIITISELMPVKLTIRSNLEAGKDITRSYGKTVDAPTIAYTDADKNKEITVKVTVPGEQDRETGEDRELTVGDTNIRKAWLNADKEELGNGKAPTDAGVYYYQLTYTDPNGVYADAKARVKVIVEPVKLVVRPTLAQKDYKKGMAAVELLKNVGYELYEKDNTGAYTKKFSIPSGEKDTFWGVTYNLVSSSSVSSNSVSSNSVSSNSVSSNSVSYNGLDRPQYYELVFEVQKRVIATTTYTDATQKPVIDTGNWTKVTILDEVSSETSDQDKTVTRTVEYRVIFSGEKGLYKNGEVISGTTVSVNGLTDVNSANTNYRVDVTSGAVEDVDNVVSISVTENQKVTINMEDIVKNIQNMELDDEGVYTKAYDEKAPFADRSAYKKAKTDTPAADKAGSFTYEWYGYDMVDKYDDNGGLVKDSAGKTVQEPVCNDDKVSTNNDYTLTTLANVGQYCLKISYMDTSNTYAADPVYLYFNIKGKLIKVTQSGEKPKAYMGGSISDFTDRIKKNESIPYSFIDSDSGADLTETLKQIDEEINDASENAHLYDLTWVVLVSDNIDLAKAQYKPVTSGLFTEGLSYKLGVSLVWTYEAERQSKYDKYTKNYTNEYERAKDDQIQFGYYCDVLDIDLEKMGDVELDIKFDSTKLASFEAEYDGTEHFAFDELVKAGYITVTANGEPKEIGDGEGQVPLDFEWDEWYVQNIGWGELGKDDVNPVNAGGYRLTVSYPGDYNYAATKATSDDTFAIKKRNLTIQVKAALEDKDITAGLDMSSEQDKALLFDDDNLTVTGYIDADKEAFAEGAAAGVGLVKDAPAFSSGYSVYVKEKDNKETYDGYLRFGKEYNVSLKNMWIYDGTVLKDKRSKNYNIIVEDAVFTVGKRGNSTVNNAMKMSVKSSIAGDAVTVTPISGICYFYDEDELGITLGENEEFVPGNYLVFDIVVPEEFNEKDPDYYSNTYKNFVYKNSIEGTGKGCVLQEADEYNGTIRVAFPVTENDQATQRKFTIRWEELDGEIYKEDFTVNMKDAQLEDDLRTAVAPKTLAFNGVNTKMAVGETQQLDVKMTKVLGSDVVFLNYEVAAGSEEYASVTKETGIVTALKKGKATINVYPVKRNNKGEVERIADFKKTVKTTIAINDVAAPKINSVYAYDNKFELKYTLPADGYRREIYVLGKKNAKAAEFESLISNAQSNGKNKLDEVFATWQYVTTEIPESKTKIVTTTVEGIEPVSEYTVYVRNVSAVRTLDDGSVVTASASGTVKSFKTTKVQLLSIRLDYDSAAEQAKTTPEEEKLYQNNSIDEIDLSQGSVRLKALGEFKVQSGNEYAEDGDYSQNYEWKELPLNKRDENYETQKLTFYALESTDSYTKEELAWNKTLKGYTTLIGDRYYKASSIAKIDKNGKLTLKGIGIVYIVAYDSVSRKKTPAYHDEDDNIDYSLEVSRSKYYAIRITSQITEIKAKKITLKAGSHVSVSPSLTFYNGSKKLAVASTMSIPLTVNANNTADIEVSGDYIIAKEPKKTANLTVFLEDSPGVQTNVTVTTKEMDPVKSLKAVDVIDHRAGITFTHTANEYEPLNAENEAVKFKIELKDNRNRLISSHIESIDPDLEKSDLTKGVYFYQYTIDELKLQSVYNVAVAPIYGEQTAKEAKVKITTTNIPASEKDLVKDVEGGMTIYIDNRYYYEGDRVTLENCGYLTSGNSYTLVADADSKAMARKTDTLTWKSTNSKVASVKANAGTFTATLKAVSVGSANIEVTSKITKKVIARYVVRVKSISNGGLEAYGDTEPKYNIAWDPYYDQGIEVLTEVNTVRFFTPGGSYDYRWVSFTAPADGKYTFTGTGATISGYYYKTAFSEQYNDGKKEEFETDGSVTLDEGETIYLKATGQKVKSSAVITVTAEKYGKLTAADSINAADYGQFTFIALEDNYYTFYASERGKIGRYSTESASGFIRFATENDVDPDTVDGVGLEKGQTVTIYGYTQDAYSISVKGRTYTGLGSDGTASISLAADGKAGSVKEKWYTFEVKAAGEYTITVSSDNAGVLRADFFEGLTKGKEDASASWFDPVTDDDGNVISLSYTGTLVEGTYAFCVSTSSDTAVNANISVSQPKTAQVSLTATSGELTVEKDKPVWVNFKVPEVGKEYCFDFVTETGKSVQNTYYRNNLNNPVSYGDLYYYGRFTSDVDDKMIYIKLTTDDDTAKVTVSVKETVAALITVSDQGLAFDVTSGSRQFYTFTAPAAGLYGIRATLAEESKNSEVYVGRVNKAGQGEYLRDLGSDENAAEGAYYVQKLNAGDKLTLAVCTSSSEARGNIRITLMPVETLESAKEYTLAKWESKWYKYTNIADTYKISYTSDNSVTVRYSASLTADGGESFYGGEKTLSAGDAMYFKVKNRNEAETKITFSIASTSQPLPADGKLSVKAGETTTYKYIVTQPGRYKVTFTADEGVEPTVSVQANSYSGSILSGEEIPCPTLAETITFNVSAKKDGVVTLSMTQIVPSTTLEGTIAKNDAQWFEYTVPITGRYSVALTDNDELEIPAGVTTWYASDKIANSLYTDLSNLNEQWLKMGEKYYIKVANNNNADQAVKVVFNVISAEESLEVGVEPKTISLKVGDVKWYSLELDETSWYNFTVEAADAAVQCFKDGNSYGTILGSSKYSLEKGKYLIKVSSSGSPTEAITVKLGVTKGAVLELKEGEDLEVSLEDGGTQYIGFKVPKTAYYAFRLKDVPADVTYVSANGDGITLNKKNVYVYQKLEIANTLNLRVNLSFTPAEGEVNGKRTVKLCAEEIKPAKLNSELSITVEKGVKSWFTFSVPESGFYSFAQDSSVVNVYCGYTIYYSDEAQLPSDSIGSADWPDSVYLYQNSKLTFFVYYNDLKEGTDAAEVPAKATFNVTAKKILTEELFNNNSKTVTLSETDSEKWYLFKPGKHDTYWFSFSGSEGTANVEIYQNGSHQNSYTIDLTESEPQITEYMYTKSTYYIRISSESPTSFEFVVRSAPEDVDVSAAEEIMVGDEKTFSVSEDDYALFAFTAPDTDQFTFYTEGKDDSYGTLMDSDLYSLEADDDDGGNMQFQITHECTGGKKYYLKVNGYDYGSLVNCTLYVIRGER